ncbi:hypothetical protein GCM10027427_05410 [Pseudoclavibacter terrae]
MVQNGLTVTVALARQVSPVLAAELATRLDERHAGAVLGCGHCGRETSWSPADDGDVAPSTLRRGHCELTSSPSHARR